MTVSIDAYTKCSCGDILAMHSATPPCPCRRADCDCEGFFLIRGDRIITTPARA